MRQPTWLDLSHPQTQTHQFVAKCRWNARAACCLVAAVAALPVTALGQADIETARSWLREQPDDPYLPGPGDPPGTAVLRSGVVVRDGFVSIQVNVDAFGQNTFGDAANEPSIAVDPTDRDRIVIGWRQFDNVASNFRQAGVAYSHDHGQTWTFNGVLQPGQFRSDPILDTDADGTFYYYSLSTLTSAEFFQSYDGGVTWTGPIPGRGGDKAWMVVDKTAGSGRGHVYATWNRTYSCCNGDFTRSTDGGFTFLQPIAVPTRPFWGTLSVGPDSELYVSGYGFVVSRSDNARNASVTPSFRQHASVYLKGDLSVGQGPNPGGLLGQAWVATDHSNGPSRGNVYLLASVNPGGDDPLDVMFSRSTDGGQTWSEAVRVNDDPRGTNAWQWCGTMSVAPNGRIDVIWNDTRADPTTTYSELYYSYSLDEGVTWSRNIPVSPPFNHFLGYPNQNKLGDYYHTVSDSGGVDVAYAATFNGEQDVYYLRIGEFDCNGNGVVDSTDIAEGTSTDCDADGLPDDCDFTVREFTSPKLSPVSGSVPLEFTIDPAPDASGDVFMFFEVSANLRSSSNKWIDVDINGVPVGRVFESNATNCPADANTEMLVVDGSTYNAALGGGSSAVVSMTPAPAVDGNFCLDSFVRVRVRIEADPDCNGNAVFDVCETASGTAADCNGNGVPDACDVASGESTDCAGNGVPDECEPDVDGDGVVDSCDPCPLDFSDDRDGDGACDSDESCPDDPAKVEPGQCGCGASDADDDGDGVANCVDLCTGVDDALFGDACAGPTPAIPAVTTWGLVVLLLVLLVGGKLAFGRRVTRAD